LYTGIKKGFDILAKNEMKSSRRSKDRYHLFMMCLVILLLSGGLVFLFLNVDFIPKPYSLERGLIDHFIQILFAIAGVFFVTIVTVLAYALIFFRRRKGDDSDARPVTGNIALEITWTLIPLAIVVVLGVYGAFVLDEIMSASPTQSTMHSVFSLGAIVRMEMAASGNASQDELIVNVTASRFAWQFDYPAYGITSYILEVPVDRRIRFNIKSEDVIHSFWVQPWGPKQDAVPGLSPVLHITPTEIGRYLVECSQLCGVDHTDMTAPVSVVSSADFDKWVRQAQVSNSPPPPAPGQQVMVMVDLTAQNIAFDKNIITVPPGATVMLTFNNKDNNVGHNFAVYTDSSATKSIFVGQIITGPKTVSYTFTAPVTPGNYFFRCDVHPTMMTGVFAVR
jgi:cytochrome c oxidase subunit II